MKNKQPTKPLDSAPPMVQRLAAVVRGRGSRFSYFVTPPSNQTVGALLSDGKGGEA